MVQCEGIVYHQPAFGNRLHYCLSYSSGPGNAKRSFLHDLPTWISGAGNGADIYTKAVGKQLFDTLAPGETGYSDGPLPRAVISLTPMEARKFGADISSD